MTSLCAECEERFEETNEDANETLQDTVKDCHEDCLQWLVNHGADQGPVGGAIFVASYLLLIFRVEQLVTSTI